VGLEGRFDGSAPVESIDPLRALREGGGVREYDDAPPGRGIELGTL